VTRIAAILAALAFAGAAFGGQTAKSAASSTVKVTAREFSLSVSPSSIAAGRVTFSVHNAGRVAHALAVSGPGLRMVRTPLIAPGTTRTLTVKLGGGAFNIWCPVGTHASNGMKTTLRVRGAAAVAPPSTTTTDPGAGYGYGAGDGY
jgi:uncharacterized cupredoxin-like copper-binding protein